MCNVVMCSLCFLTGTVAGVLLMCLLQAGRQADERFGEMKRGGRQDAV